MERVIRFFDTTLRDGEQAPGYSMNLREKLEFAAQLEKLGVDVIEAGFPASSEEDFLAVQAVARQIHSCYVTGLCRAVPGDIERCYDAVREADRPMMNVFIATSELHMQYKLHMDRSAVLAAIEQSVRRAKQLCGRVQFTAEDASRSDRDFLLRALQTAVNAGADAVTVTDTVGYATPEEIKELIGFVVERLKRPEQLDIGIHCHDDLGLAVANSLAAIEAGATQVECTVNGIGERAGNAALEEIVMGLSTRAEHYGVKTDVATRQIYRTSRLLSTLTDVPVPPNKAVVGANAFAHEAGIHQHGLMNNRLTYEIMTPESIGIYQSQIVLGKHSGRHAFEERLDELGYRLNQRELEEAFEKFKALADHKRDVTDRDIEALVNASSFSMVETYQLKSFVINSGTIISATAVVRLIRDGEEIEHVARGTGPVDASFKAIDRIVKLGYHLESYRIQAVTEGEDALGEVVVRITNGSESITGRGLSTDVIESSIRAYLSAINKAIASH